MSAPHGFRSSLLGLTPRTLLGLCLGCAGFLHAQPTPIRFAPEKDYGPFVFADEQGQVRGLSIDVLDAVRPMLSRPIHTQPAQALAQILEGVRRGEVDLVSSLRPTRERSGYLSFTAPYVRVPAVLVQRQSVSPARLADLAGQRVAVGQGFAVEAFVRTSYPRIAWMAVPDDASALRGVLRGEYAAAVADIASVSFVVRKHQLRGLQVVEAVGFDYPLSFAYRKELSAFGQELQAALQRLPPQQRQQILDRWIDSEALHFEDPRRRLLRWLGLGLGLLGVALLLTVYWRRKRMTVS